MDEVGGQAYEVVSPLFTLLCVSGTAVAIFVLSWLHVQVFTPRDALYAITPLSTNILNELGGSPTVVETGFLLERFHDFNVIENRFLCEGSLWFRFDPALISLETIDGIVLGNGSFIERNKVYMKQLGGRLFVQYAVRISFQVAMNYASFPTDDHRLYIALLHPEASPAEFVFESARADFVIEENMATRGWFEHDRVVATGYTQTNITSSSLEIVHKHPLVYFGMDFRRASIRDLVTILLPLLALYFVSLCAFSVNRMRYWPERMNIILQSIVGLIAFRFVMETIAPKVSYFMRSDYLFLLFLGICSLLFMINFLAQRMSVLQEQIVIISCSLFVVCAYCGMIVWL